MMNKSMIDKKLNIRLENGTTSTGKTAVKTVSFSNVKLDASDEDMFAAGNAYATLVTLPLESVRMTDLYELTSDGE